MKKNDFRDYIVEILTPLGDVKSRSMFGGFGVYFNDFFVAIIVDDVLFFKTNDETRAHFLKANCKPFQYESKGRHVSLSYFEAPTEAIDSTETIAPWLRLALEAATSAPPKKSKSRNKK